MKYGRKCGLGHERNMLVKQLKRLQVNILSQEKVTNGLGGKSLTETLFNLAEVTTWVMRPLKLDRNPYLLEHKNYFEKRREIKVAAKFRAAIYKKYAHTCPVCGQSLHNGEPIELHHVQP